MKYVIKINGYKVYPDSYVEVLGLFTKFTCSLREAQRFDTTEEAEKAKKYICNDNFYRTFRDCDVEIIKVEK